MKLGRLALLFAVLVMVSCSRKNEAPRVVERPKLPEIDPTDSTIGLGIRILTQGAKIVDTSMPKASKNAFRISIDSVDVVEMERGGSKILSLRSIRRNAIAKEILLGWNDEKKHLVLPILKQDTSNGVSQFNLVLDSSLIPSLFEITLAERDTSGVVSKHLNKWVVIKGSPVDEDSLLIGRWQTLKCNLGDNNRGHFMHFDTVHRVGEWWNSSYYNGNLEMELALLFHETEPNWDNRFKVFDDSVQFYDKDWNSGDCYRYRIFWINERRMGMRETDRKRSSYWVQERVQNGN